MLRVGSVVLACAASASIGAQTPSLVEITEKERIRHEAIDKRSRTYTNDDLHGGSRLTTRSSRTVEADDSDLSPNVPGDDRPPEAVAAQRDEAY